MSVLTRVMEESLAKGTDRMVLVVLAFRSDLAGLCWPGYKWVGDRAGVKPPAVARSIRALEASGELVRFARTRPDGGQRSNMIFLAKYANRAAVDDHIRQGGECAALILAYLTEFPDVCPRAGKSAPPPSRQEGGDSQSDVPPVPSDKGGEASNQEGGDVRLDGRPPSGQTGHDSIEDPTSDSISNTSQTKSGADADLEAPADDTGTDTVALVASALIDLDPSDSDLDLVDDPAEDALDRTAHWAGGSPEFNELADQLARWMGKSTAGLHAATAKAIKSGAGRLLAREVTGELVKTVYGKRWFREHWAGSDRSKTLVARSPRDMRQIEDWIATCNATPAPADHALIDAALAPAGVYPALSQDHPQGEASEGEAPEQHPWLAYAIDMSGVKPGSVWGQILGQARLVGIEAGLAVVELADERAVENMTPRAHALRWPSESGATSTRFVAAGLETQVAA